MKRTFVFFLMVTLFFGGLQANPVDVNTAKSLGIKFMNTNTEIRSAKADLVYTACADNGQAAFYVFAVQPAPNPSWAIPPKAISPPNSPTV